ncbi:MAG: hypothetical protein JXA10_06445, partial [Anaerolineae bacterium]|nr:hypothetical protein [Anaerolineae bacterium]
MAADQSYNEATTATATDLKQVAHSEAIRQLSSLSLPEIDSMIELIALAIPAGNVPGMILSGLSRLKGRGPSAQEAQRDINRLFQGVHTMLDRAMFAATFVGPASVLWGYQNLLKLTGKTPEKAFPEGTWQFYVDYALREDTARHINETHGFNTMLKKHGLSLSLTDRITAWVMAALHILHDYDELLTNEWRERIILALLNEVITAQGGAEGVDTDAYARLYRTWEKQRPYGRGQDSDPRETYPAYRRRKFDEFVAEATRDLPRKLRQSWDKHIKQREATDLPAYLRQLSMVSYLQPGLHGETRTPITLGDAHIGVIHDGHYHLIPVAQSRLRTLRPVKVDVVRSQIQAMLDQPAPPDSDSLMPLATMQRSALANLLPHLGHNSGSKTMQHDLDQLKFTPILLNFDHIPRHVPLSDLRQAERGIGHHALTIFDTRETFAFDQSHIYFDGAWGAALAEIITREAIAWAVYLHDQPAPKPAKQPPVALNFQFDAREKTQIAKAPQVAPHVSAESNRADLDAMQLLRRALKARNETIHLTINDLLILYRAIHALTYQPDPTILGEIKRRAKVKTTRDAYKAAEEALSPYPASILMPVDASHRNPRDRLYPMAFEVPLGDLDLLNLHKHTLEALDEYEQAVQTRSYITKRQERAYETFTDLQRHYLATLAGFGMLMHRAKTIGAEGQTASVSTIKLLAHLPTPLQRLLDQLPNYFDIINDIVKGREVFSNVGAVVPSSTLTRFATAKDDNFNKTLSWGILTDHTGTMVITLRDFRPYVKKLVELDQRTFAARLAQDYLDGYV